MSPLNSKGGFHINPQVGRMHDSAPPKPKSVTMPNDKPGKKKDGDGDHDGVEIRRGPGADGTGNFHTIHHPSGESRSHETLHDAHHAANDHFAEDGCKGDGSCEHAGASNAAEPMEGAEEDDDAY